MTSDKKTRNRTEDVAAERVVSEDKCSAQVDAITSSLVMLYLG